MINPGELKIPISFYKKETKVDEEGFKVNTLTKILTTKCNPYRTQITDNNRSGSPNYDSVSSLIYCRLRYNKNIDENAIAEINGMQYRIKNYSNVGFQNKILELVLQHG